MKHLVSAFALCLILVMAGCQSPVTVPKTDGSQVGTLVGTVSAPPGGSSQGAEVWLSGTSHRTVVGADGTFGLSNVAAGTYDLNVAKSGYARVLKTATVVAGAQTSQPAIQIAILTSSESIALTGTAGATAWAFSSIPSEKAPERRVTLNYSVPTGGADVFYLLTNVNTALTTHFGGSGPVANTLSVPDRQLRPLPGKALLKDYPGLAESGMRALNAARNRTSGRAVAPVSPAPEELKVGANLTFTDAFWEEGAEPGVANQHPATLRKVASRDGHILNVWVSDAAWDDDGNGTPAVSSLGLVHGVSQTMVDALASRFLGTAGNDLYSWVTALYGPEWPASGAPTGWDGTLIDGGGQVHIFLVNLNSHGTDNGVMMGYFHSLNSVVGETGSNGKVLFALDANSLANPDDSDDSTQDTWEIGDYWPAEIVSTLAHEFQHMIHFYQKQVKHNSAGQAQPIVWTDTWIDEMASLVTEDLVADKLGVPGPRGTAPSDYSSGLSPNTSGRMPLFNLFHDVVSLTRWGSFDLLASYSSSYAFGAWLLRNYGGPALFRDIVTGPATTSQAVVEAVNTHNGTEPDATFASLVRDWGLATFLGAAGNRVGLNYQSVSTNGAFDWTLDTQPYSVGSIDPWKYRISYGNGETLNGPWVAGDGVLDSSRWVAAGSTYYHWAGRQTAGDKSVDLTLPPGVALTLVVKP